MLHRILLASTLLSGPALAQSYTSPTFQAPLILGAPAKPAGAVNRAYMDARMGSRMIVTDPAFGNAACTGTSGDDTAAFQAAMQNEAGQIILEVGAGKLDVTDLAAVRARANVSAEAINAKLPAAVDLLQPLEGAIAGAIVGKLGVLAAVAGSPVQTGAAA